MYGFWYDYIKLKYQQNANLCYMDTDSVIIQIRTEDVYEDIADDIEKRLDTPNYEINRQFPTKKNKKLIGLMKDELGGQNMTEFAVLRSKTYFYLVDYGSND